MYIFILAIKTSVFFCCMASKISQFELLPLRQKSLQGIDQVKTKTVKRTVRCFMSEAPQSGHMEGEGSTQKEPCQSPYLYHVFDQEQLMDCQHLKKSTSIKHINIQKIRNKSNVESHKGQGKLSARGNHCCWQRDEKNEVFIKEYN